MPQFRAFFALASITLLLAAAPAPSHSLPLEANAPVAYNAASVDAAVQGLASEQGSPTLMELALFELVNRDRAFHGLAPVAFDPDLLGLARERAMAQRVQLPLTHRDEAGQLEFTKGLTALGVAFGAAGENLVRVPFTDDHAPEAAQSALMKSEPHRAIILLPSFDRIAVGTAVDGPGTMVFVQIFVALH